MILPSYLEEEVKKYCKIAKIPLVNGSIPKQYMPEIEEYIKVRLRKDRAITKLQEDDKELQIGFILKSLINPEKFLLEDSPMG